MEPSLPNRFVYVAISLLFILPLAIGDGSTALTYHGGPLLTGNINLSILFYGRFGQVQKSALRGFLKSLNYEGDVNLKPQVSSWWGVVESYQSFAGRNAKGGKIRVRVAKQVVDASCSVGKVMSMDFIKILVQKATAVAPPNSIPIIFTARDVTVQGLCTGKCADHGVIDGHPYVIVGNPETECPGACAWPFRKSDYGPKGMILQPPSGDIAADAMVASLASGLASLVTNPYNTGFFGLGRKSTFIEATAACPAMFGSGALPGYTGKVRVDPRTGGAFNAHGVKGKKFLLPALWNPTTSSCWTPL